MRANESVNERVVHYRLAIVSFAILTIINQAFANMPPIVSVPLQTYSFPEDNSLTIAAMNHFSDPDGFIDTLFCSTDNSNVLALVHQDSITFVLKQDWFGTCNVTVTAVDDSGANVSSGFHIIVSPVNDPPVFRTPIPALAMRNNDNFFLPLKRYATDVDDSILAFSLLPFNGITTRATDSGIFIIPLSFIDTATLTCIVRDPAGLADTTVAKIFTNLQTPQGLSFNVLSIANPRKSTHNGQVANTFSNGRVVFLWSCQDTIFADIYKENGQKAIPTKSLINLSMFSPPKQTIPFFACTAIGKNTLLAYRFGQSDHDLWQLMILDSALNITASTLLPRTLLHFTAAKIGNNILLYGAESDSNISIQVYDQSLHLNDTAIISSNDGSIYTSAILPTKKGYTFVWGQGMYPNVVFWYREFTNQHAPLGPKMLFDPVAGHKVGPDSLWRYVEITPAGSDFLVTMISKAPNQSYVMDLYIALLDSNFALKKGPVFVDGNNGMANWPKVSVYLGDRFYVGWNASISGPCDPVTRRECYYSLSLDAIGAAKQTIITNCQDTLGSYFAVNDTLMFRTSFDLADNECGRFMPVKGLPIFISRRLDIGDSPSWPVSMKHLSFNLPKTKPSGDKIEGIFDIQGRRCRTFSLGARIQERLPSCIRIVVSQKSHQERPFRSEK